SIQVAQTFFESRGYGIGSAPSAPVQYASAETAAGDSDAPTATTAVAFTSAPANTAGLTATTGSFTAALNGSPSQESALRPAREAAAPARQAAGRWSVQVGAFRD